MNAVIKKSSAKKGERLVALLSKSFTFIECYQSLAFLRMIVISDAPAI